MTVVLKIAIQPDEQLHANGEQQSYSARWMELAHNEDGIEAVPVDVFAPDAIEQIAACDAFMWRFSPSAHPRLYAKRLLQAVEHGLGIPVFPSINTAWHAEDKIGQYYLLKAAGIPTPPTHIFWHREQAEQFCDAADYPFVIKLAAGYQAANVRLVRNRSHAQYYIDQLFDPGMVSFGWEPASPARLFLRRVRAAKEIVSGRYPYAPTGETELQHGYFYAQDFLPGNEFDVRVTIIGQRAFAFRRFNRTDDFRASGAGLEDYDSRKVNESVIRLAYRVASELQVQTVAVDILCNGVEPVICEMGVTYPAYGVRECSGLWFLNGSPVTGGLEWIGGSSRAEDAIFEDFIAHVRQAGADDAQTATASI